MAIVKDKHELREVRLAFDATGEVTDVVLVVSYALKDDVADEILAERGLSKSVWTDLNVGQQTAINTLGKRFKTLAETF